ncbi:hypothetical protein ACFOZ7_04875 [Natribaculum luteum]|uniref:Cytochrome oxidase subunit I profile domain-containing protein n=1 Tax=Natribaculum luteum TaxID=1586232 RepID=A0ABD5NW81_9EURY|nr:hypothetical protein [Natribaculum luteum]
MQMRKDPFLLVAGLYLTVGLLAVGGRLAFEAGLIESLPRLRWLTIHFVTIGGMTQALFGLLPSLVGAADGSRADINEGSRWLQWLVLNASYPLVLIGMAAGSTITAVVGATGVLVALALLAVTVYRTSAGGHELLRYYRIAPWFLVAGLLAALGMLSNVHGPGGYFGSIEAHVHANVWGFLALVVAATLLLVLPVLLETDLRYPHLVPVTFWGLTLGAGGLVAGPWLARHALTMLGLVVYVGGTVALLANVVGTCRASDRSPNSRVALVLGAYLWLVFPVPWAPFVLLLPDVVPAGAIEVAAIDGLVFGWMLQLAMAFLPVAAVALDRTDGDRFLENVVAAADAVPRPSWLQVGSVNVGVLALWLSALPPLEGVGDALTLGGYALIAVAWTLFAASLWWSIADAPASGTRHVEDVDVVRERT